ncbi:putative bifunctional diguanylate cyclase/phosphodiesterase [Pseudomonas sp. TTU2014-080ASC]|uniref:putative bifunctional diguanylate cyclase/phosphodiesterase n=1 Tax=Pseudomonas sp. TTU2014-080ASC TaxID=1729724 RepID=UPI00071876C4|nr:bifunctional diguanylate cyclase/phosphodiesterase [Pseudomonas sp. TTU2014-080ASC]KRW62279.1 diguanylate phosphodiesterase [Pseudomonas sp. TTU2014-080ASC]
MQWFPVQFLSELPLDHYVVLTCSHTLWLVLLSYLIAVFGSHITLTIAKQASRTANTIMKRVWTVLGAICLAGGIWTMHFIGMLAFKAPVSIHYDLSVTLFSFLVALTASLIAMHYMTMQAPRMLQQILAAVLIGVGISAMHYSGMTAMQSVAKTYHHPGLFALSILVAISASYAALKLAEYFRDGEKRNVTWLKYSAAMVMGAAICSMHYTGMSGLYLVVPDNTPLQLRSADNSVQLGLIIASITFLILSLSLAAAWASRKLEEKEQDLQRVNILLHQLDQAQASLEQIAHFDPLTEQLNRRGFNRVFNAAIEEHTISGRNLAVMFLDVDHFKRVNDTLGHDAGDELLRIVAQRIRSSLRERDIVSRLGGDEFCIVTSIDSDDALLPLANRILEKMKEPINLGERKMVMTTSIGISRFPQDGVTVEELIKHADLALYQAKADGRNTIHVFKQHLTEKASIELQLEEDLRQALQLDKDLKLYYQPIIDLSSGEVTRLEALIRWQHPRLGLLTPERFIGIAEANGFVELLDKWVMQQACKDLAIMLDQGYRNTKIAVNCSAINLTHNLLSESISDALQGNNLLAERLEIEVTESTLLSNIRCVKNQLESIKRQGVSIALDDFGTGYSSLTYLRRLPLDVLKIDRSFIKEITESPQDREIVRAIISMAHALNMKTVAEGVETNAQLSLLVELSCDQVQGYLFSKPQPMEEIHARFPPKRPVLESAYAKF